MKQSKNEFIRKASSILGPYANNQQIKNYCKDNFGFTPISQQIYSTLGAESLRLSENYTAREVAEMKSTINNKFGGDYDRALNVIHLIGTFR